VTVSSAHTVGVAAPALVRASGFAYGWWYWHSLEGA